MKTVSLLIKPASGACNMKCKYCFYRDVAENRSVGNFGMMKEETLRVLIERAFEYDADEYVFAFQGGEPTLAGLSFFRSFEEFITQYNIKGKAVWRAIQTNGYCIDGEWAEFFRENNFLVGLSLDGDKAVHDELRQDAEGHGTFNRIMRTAGILDAHRVEYNILCVVTNFSARHGSRLYSFFKKNGFKYLQFIQCLDDFDGKKKPYSLTAERYGDFLNSIFERYYSDFITGDYVSIRMFDNYVNMLLGRAPESCGMSGKCDCYFVIESDGSVYPCDFYVLDEWKLGNIYNNTFSEMRSCDTAKRFVASSEFVSPECSGCRWFGICRGGCRRCREPFLNGNPVLNKFCESYKIFFEHSYEKLCSMAELIRRG